MAAEAGGPFDGLPEFLREVAEVAGLEAAMKLAWDYGGVRIRIPRRASTNHWLVKSVGRKAADALCKHFSVNDADDRPMAMEIVVPQAGTGVMAQAKRRLADDLRSGRFSVRAAARRNGLTERTAWRMKAKLSGKEDTDQPDLFRLYQPEG